MIVSSREISVGTTKIRAVVTKEMIDDLKSYPGIDYNGELERILIKEISLIKGRKKKIEELLEL